jgi:hypothetical protein
VTEHGILSEKAQNAIDLADGEANAAEKAGGVNGPLIGLKARQGGEVPACGGTGGGRHSGERWREAT